MDVVPGLVVGLLTIIFLGFLVAGVSAGIFRKLSDPSPALDAEVARNYPGAPDRDAYTVGSSLLSEAERTFLQTLDQAVPPNTRVFVQVALAAIISPRKGSSTWQRDRNRIAQKVVDFVVCDQWAKPLVAVELDDASHKKTKRADRDELLDSILSNVGLRVIHVRAAGSYDVEALRAELSPMASPR